MRIKAAWLRALAVLPSVAGMLWPGTVGASAAPAPGLLPLPADQDRLPPLPPARPLEPGADEADVAPDATPRPDTSPPEVPGGLRFPLGGLVFAGGTVFSDEGLLKAPVTARTGERGVETVESRVGDYVGREVTAEDLEAIRQALTRLYLNEGYINSGALLPDQTIQDDGVVTYRLVEGRLTDINLIPEPGPRLKYVRRGYLLQRIRPGARFPLNITALRDQLELLRQNPNVRRVNAELRPGAEPGEAYLDVAVEEAFPLRLGLQFSNRRSPSVGSEQLEVLASHRSLTGNGDLLSVRYGVNRGGIDEWEWAGLDDFGVDYTYPLTARDTTVSISYTKTDALVVEDQFRELDIESESNNVALTLRHPLRRTVNSELAAFASLAYRDNATFLLGEPFSFSPGAEDGRSAVTAVRLGQEYVTRDQRQALSARSTFTVGIDAFGSTVHGDGGTPDGGDGEDDGELPDSQFLSWLGQLQYVRRLDPPRAVLLPQNTTFVVRLGTQLTADPLLSTEQFAVGGFDTVRGYRENQVVRDNAVVGSVELHLPLLESPSGGTVLELVPFFDAGCGWNHSDHPSGRQGESLYSVGAGVVFTPNRHFSAQVYYGYALKDPEVEEEGEELQDLGIHFSLLYLAF